jgi:hypothetical protein
MTTKKQKRAAVMAKREAFLAKVKAEGLKALERDRERRAKNSDDLMSRKIEEINDRHAAILARHGIKRPEKQTSFYSEAQGRPVNAATIASEKKRQKELDNSLKTLIEYDLDEWAGLRATN